MTTHAAVSQNARAGMVGAQGRRSVLQLAAEAERKALVAELLAGLGRPARAIDRVAIGALSAAMIQSRRLRRQGRNGSEERRLIAQMMRTTGIKPDKPVPSKPAEEDFHAEMLRTRHANGRCRGARRRE